MQNLFLYKNKSFVALILFLVVSLSLMFFNVRFPTFNIRSIFFFLTYPIQYSVSSVGSFFVNSATSISKIQQLENELKFTKERLIKYQEALLLSSQINKENEELRNALSMKSRINQITRYARIIFRDPSLTGDYFIIDKGVFDGIKQNMPAVSYNSDGKIYLVGRISEANVSASKVKLITAADSYVGVTLKNSGYVGILKGNGSWNQNTDVEYIPFEANVEVGEEVVTSGESDIFPAGILIGNIIAIDTGSTEDFFKKLYVKPEYKYNKINDVFIIEWKPGIEIKDLIENAEDH